MRIIACLLGVCSILLINMSIWSSLDSYKHIGRKNGNDLKSKSLLDNMEGDCCNAPMINDTILSVKTLESKHEVLLNKDGISTVGRLETCTLHIPQMYISRIHAYIICENNYIYIKNNSATNRTYINGKILQDNERHQVSDGDILSFADSQYQLLSSDEKWFLRSYS